MKKAFGTLLHDGPIELPEQNGISSCFLVSTTLRKASNHRFQYFSELHAEP